MKQNYKNKLVEILQKNKGLITRKEVEERKIPTTFLYRFIKEKKLLKLDTGMFATQEFQNDDLFLLQKKYPQIIYSGLTALSLNDMTDKLVEKIEITVIHGSNSIRDRNDILTHTVRDKDLLNLGVIYRETRFGNLVKTYGPERLFCNLVKYRSRIDPEVFVKGIHMYLDLTNTNQRLLFFIAEKLNIKMEVLKILEVINEY